MTTSGVRHGVARDLEERAVLLAEVERTAQLGTWTWDLETNEVVWSPELFRILGYDPDVDAPSTEAFFMAVHPADRDRVRAISAHVVRERHLVPAEHRLLRRSGEVRHVLSNGVGIFDTQGQLIRVVGTVLDLTERNQLEEQLRQSQKMEAIGRLAGGVAHDFNNLLTIVSVNAQILLHEGPREELKQIVTAVEHAAELTRRLLMFSRRSSVDPVPLDVNDVLSGAVKLFSRVIGDDVQISLELSPDIGQIRADSSQIHQVLLNLVLNARDAMPHGGDLTIRTEPRDAEVLIEVRDTGIGMDEHTRSRIFEPFFTTKSPDKGTGLGLSTVFGIVQQSGGSIEVTSEPGKGTSFLLRFPLIEEDRPIGAPAPISAQIARSRGETILVVEDNHDVSQVMAHVLRRAGYVVHVASRPSEAIQILAEHPGDIALIVTDLLLPEATGPELLHKLRASRPLLKALFVTGIDTLPELLASLDGPVLKKPFTPDALLAQVRQVLAGDTSAPRERVGDRSPRASAPR